MVRSMKAQELIKAFVRNGWELVRKANHIILRKSGYHDEIVRHGRYEVGGALIAKIVKRTGLVL